MLDYILASMDDDEDRASQQLTDARQDKIIRALVREVKRLAARLEHVESTVMPSQ